MGFRLPRHPFLWFILRHAVCLNHRIREPLGASGSDAFCVVTKVKPGPTGGLRAVTITSPPSGSSKPDWPEEPKLGCTIFELFAQR